MARTRVFSNTSVLIDPLSFSANSWVGKVAERKFPEFFEFLSRILSRISLRIFPEFFEEFSCFVSWDTETRKNSPKIPAIFQCKVPRQTRKKNIHKILLESRQSKKILHSKVLVERFWVKILLASCSNKLLVGTLRPSHFATLLRTLVSTEILARCLLRTLLRRHFL